MLARAFGLAALFLGALASISAASTKAELESAIRLEKIAFLLVTDRGAAAVDRARQTIERAMPSVGRSTLIVLDRSEPQNADLVAKFRLAGAPVPLILVAARNGALAGGIVASQATPEKLVAMVPSPKKAEILKYLESGKSVFIYASRRSMTTQGAASCAAACARLDGKCVTVSIDMDDPKETKFLEQLKVGLASMEPVTLVVNGDGQLTGTYTGAADIANLVQAATKKAGGCCPTTVQGGGKTCPPAK